MKNKILKYFAIILIAVLISSCGCSCHCDRNLGCRVITIKLTSNDSLIFRKYCSQTNYYTDKIVKDSINAFFSKYQSISTIIINKDSIYKYENVSNVKCDERVNYENKGYGCSCAK